MTTRKTKATKATRKTGVTKPTRAKRPAEIKNPWSYNHREAYELTRPSIVRPPKTRPRPLPTYNPRGPFV